jgi:NAD(P)-dependent dehydrogenase (short-subunit alcohol dehydrogenase family)
MEIGDRVVVVTGGGTGIGRALCERFGTEGARAVVVADLDEAAAGATASSIAAQGGTAISIGVDVANEAQVVALVDRAIEAFGRIDLFCSNAGIFVEGGAEAPNESWERIWAVNVMAHVYAARAVLPAMIERGEGCLLNTASAAGLLTNLGAAPYSVTKHAAVAFAEWLAITHGSDGIQVSCLCPQAVRTNMLLGSLDASDPTAAALASSAVLASGAVLEPAEVAEAVVNGLRDERFLILPHPEVGEYFRRKGDDPERWIEGMRRLQARVNAAGPPA